MHRSEVTAIAGFKQAKANREADARREALMDRRRSEAAAAARRRKLTIVALALLVAVDVILWAQIIAEWLA